jgi:hypothetical protein
MLKTSLISIIAFIGLTAASPTSTFEPSPVSRPTHALSTQNPAISDFSVVNLQNGAELTIGYATQGCFNSSYGNLKISADGVTYKGKTKPLSMAQAVGLDTYFQQLSAKAGKAGGCTTATELVLTVRRNGEVISTQNLRDDFCRLGEGAMSPDHIRYDLFEREEVEQQTLIIK